VGVRTIIPRTECPTSCTLDRRTASSSPDKNLFLRLQWRSGIIVVKNTTKVDFVVWEHTELTATWTLKPIPHRPTRQKNVEWCERDLTEWGCRVSTWWRGGECGESVVSPLNGGHCSRRGTARWAVDKLSLGELWGVASVCVMTGGGVMPLVPVPLADNSDLRRTTSSIESLSWTTVTVGGNPNRIFSTTQKTRITGVNYWLLTLQCALVMTMMSMMMILMLSSFSLFFIMPRPRRGGGGIKRSSASVIRLSVRLSVWCRVHRL